ncbi:hypothetical protein KSP40_PGU000430 [Platanthera guangdongensis]|uniref:RNase H type-1 domain-containing protein n=1 Tax=Platanthera guangdongensis TaxID=2320717 RepID=A0ABR2MI58_9ASPA
MSINQPVQPKAQVNMRQQNVLLTNNTSRWSPPDGSLQPSRCAGLGIVVCSEAGTMLVAAGFACLHWDPGLVELEAVLAIRRVVLPTLFEARGIIIEGDAANVLEFCSSVARGSARPSSFLPEATRGGRWEDGNWSMSMGGERLEHGKWRWEEGNGSWWIGGTRILKPHGHNLSTVQMSGTAHPERWFGGSAPENFFFAKIYSRELLCTAVIASNSQA